MTNTYTCWRGGLDIDDRMDEVEVRAGDASEAAEKFAFAHEDGEDYDIVFVLAGNEVHEFKCDFDREVTCSARRTATHALPADDEVES